MPSRGGGHRKRETNAGEKRKRGGVLTTNRRQGVKPLCIKPPTLPLSPGPSAPATPRPAHSKAACMGIRDTGSSAGSGGHQNRPERAYHRRRGWGSLRSTAVRLMQTQARSGSSQRPLERPAGVVFQSRRGAGDWLACGRFWALEPAMTRQLPEHGMRRVALLEGTLWARRPVGMLRLGVYLHRSSVINGSVSSRAFRSGVSPDLAGGECRLRLHFSTLRHSGFVAKRRSVDMHPLQTTIFNHEPRY
jgi:hypothetical protein